MKNNLLKIILVMIIFSTISAAQTKGFGLGILVGEPTAVSAKYWTSGSTAFDFGIGYSFEKNSYLNIHADYLFHVKNIFETTENISFYYGPGARLRFVENATTRLGFRFDVGLVWIPRNAPIDVYIELAPILDIIPETDFLFNSGVGVRFFFN